LSKIFHNVADQEKKYFDFPFDTSKMKNPLNFRERPGLPTIYEGDLYHIDWIRVYVYPCNWRGTESLMVSNYFKIDSIDGKY
jgi:hypothetical protein